MLLRKSQTYVASISYRKKHYTLKRSKDINECIKARKKAEEKIRELAKEEIKLYKSPTESFTEWYEHTFRDNKSK